MHIDRTTLPGCGVLHDIMTRDGGRFCVLTDSARNRCLCLFTLEDGHADVHPAAVLLEPDEADQLAEILHSQPFANRLLSPLGRRDDVTGER
jgi:TrkA domain protein